MLSIYRNIKFVLLGFFFLPALALAQSDTPQQTMADSVTKTVFATYYAKKFEGRKTTSGERYRAKKFTAAHRSLPFGTLVNVTNLSNGLSVKVKINDRGPFSKKFSIDLSERAAKAIGMFRKGSAQVEISYVLESDGK